MEDIYGKLLQEELLDLHFRKLQRYGNTVEFEIHLC